MRATHFFYPSTKREVPRGYSAIKETGVLVVPFRGFLKIWGLVPLRVLKPKMTAARVVSIPFRGIR